MKKMILMNPGPVNVTGRVRRALLQPDICHREAEFSALLGRVGAKLSRFLGTAKSHSLAFFSGSGTTALEAMLSTFAEDEKKILVLSNGVYGERMRDILTAFGTPVAFLEAPLGAFPDSTRVDEALRRDPSIHAVAMVHHETSTGMLNPLAEITRVAKRHGKFLLVDAISSLGAETLDLSSVDLLAGTSGKCLHGFPGVSFVLVSARAKSALASKRRRSLSLDLTNALAQAERGDTAFTPVVQIFYAFEAALDEALKETLPGRIRRYRRLSGILHDGMKRLGTRFLVEERFRSHVLTGFWLPDGVSYTRLHQGLRKAGFVIYAGQSKLKDRIFRIANLGDIRPGDMKRFLQTYARIVRG